MELTFGSMFAGCGGGDLGLTQAGWRCVWSNEIDKYASQIYRKNLGDKHLVEADIRDIHTDSIPDFTLLIAGFPCQSFSVAGKRKGTAEARGTLFAQIIRIAAAKRPKLLLLENVKGLLSSDNGRTFAQILRSLGNLGYILQWEVINSKHFIPQNRERVFIIGHLGEGSFRQIFPIGPSDGTAIKVWLESQRQISINSEGRNGENPERYDVYPCLTPDRPNKRQHGRRFKEPGEEMFTLTAQDKHGVLIWQLPRNKDRKCLYGEDEQLQALRTCQRPPNPNIISHAIRSGGKGSLDRHSWDIISNGQRIRRLTPTECERLQGFPDGWTVGVSDTQRYKMVGNAMTVPVIKFLGEQLLASFGGK